MSILTTSYYCKDCKVLQSTPEQATTEILTTCGVFYTFRSIHWLMYFCCKTNWKGAEIGEQFEFGGDWTAGKKEKKRPSQSMMKLSLLNSYLQSFISGRRCELLFWMSGVNQNTRSVCIECVQNTQTDQHLHKFSSVSHIAQDDCRITQILHHYLHF